MKTQMKHFTQWASAIVALHCWVVAAIAAQPLPPDAKEQAKLKELLANLAVPAGHTPNVIRLPSSPAAPKK